MKDHPEIIRMRYVERNPSIDMTSTSTLRMAKKFHTPGATFFTKDDRLRIGAQSIASKVGSANNHSVSGVSSSPTSFLNTEVLRSIGGDHKYWCEDVVVPLGGTAGRLR